MTETAESFLVRYGMLDPDFNMIGCAKSMLTEMQCGLEGNDSSYPMIPTYLNSTGLIPEGKHVVVIDAGGTNFRAALAHFHDGACILEKLRKTGMPGIDRPVSWGEFISFVADEIEDLVPCSNWIGFCFSYNAEILPNLDGRVVCIDKEVTVTGCEGQLVGQDLCRELERRGFPGKRAVILNDTAAVQLGGMAKHLRDGYSACFGQVSGTGTNTCCTVPAGKIQKLGSDTRSMIVNMESGMYDGIRQGEFDRRLDAASHNPGQKRFEKMTAGVYLGELCHIALSQAAEDAVLSDACCRAIRALPHVDSAIADDWAMGKKLDVIQADEEDCLWIESLARLLFERSATLMCANLTAMTLLTDLGINGKGAVIAEGSLVQRNHFYRPKLEELLNRHVRGDLNRSVDFVVEQDTTLPGAAAAALLNLQ